MTSMTHHHEPPNTHTQKMRRCLGLHSRRPQQAIRGLSATQTSSDVSPKFWTIPNVITLSRIAMSPALTLAIACDMKSLALGGCIIGAISDWADGYIAKNYNQKV
jgi:hypothetical protein